MPLSPAEAVLIGYHTLLYISCERLACMCEDLKLVGVPELLTCLSPGASDTQAYAPPLSCLCSTV